MADTTKEPIERTLQMDTLHEIIDNLTTGDQEEDYAIVVIDEKNFSVFKIKDVFVNSIPGSRILSLVINTSQKVPVDKK